jgi:dGTPase
LAYLVEAADDICYTILIEDGINLWTSIRGFCAEYLIKLVKDSIDTPSTRHLRQKKKIG